MAEIEQLLGELTREYISRGFITTRVYLPAQDLSRGTLNIMVLEGVVESIVLDNGAQRSINPRNVFPSPGGLLNLRDFEQGIDQVNKLSSNSAQLDIQPGAAAGVVDVAGQVIPLRVYAGLDAGRVSSRNAELPRGHLAGVVLGLAANWKGVGVDLSATRAIGRSDLFTREATQAWVRLNIDL